MLDEVNVEPLNRDLPCTHVNDPEFGRHPQHHVDGCWITLIQPGSRSLVRSGELAGLLAGAGREDGTEVPAATDPTFEAPWLIGRIYPRSLESGQRDLFPIFGQSRIKQFTVWILKCSMDEAGYIYCCNAHSSCPNNRWPLDLADHRSNDPRRGNLHIRSRDDRS